MYRAMLSIVLSVLALASCERPPTPVGGEASTVSQRKTGYRVEEVARGLSVPWSIVFTPDGRILFTERPGRIRVVTGGKLVPEPLATLPAVASASESGLMGMTLHPGFSQNRWIYIAYAYRGEGGQLVRVERHRETGSGLADRTVIIENIPAAPNHAGTRLGFGPDGKLYITTGDATERQLAQRLDSLAGKTLRLNDDGSVPSDNPFVGRDGARPEIWTLGHRNAQGLDWQPGSGLMFQTEHGPSGFDGPGGGDEVNVVERGKNYGWPVIHHEQTKEGYVAPLVEYTPAVAPASGMFYDGSLFPEWRGNLFFGALRGTALIRIAFDGRRVVSQERMFDGEYGRIREVAEGPDGAIYFSTSNRDGRGRPAEADDRIFRIVPAKADSR